MAATLICDQPRVWGAGSTCCEQTERIDDAQILSVCEIEDYEAERQQEHGREESPHARRRTQGKASRCHYHSVRSLLQESVRLR